MLAIGPPIRGSPHQPMRRRTEGPATFQAGAKRSMSDAVGNRLFNESPEGGDTTARGLESRGVNSVSLGVLLVDLARCVGRRSFGRTTAKPWTAPGHIRPAITTRARNPAKLPRRVPMPMTLSASTTPTACRAHQAQTPASQPAQPVSAPQEHRAGQVQRASRPLASRASRAGA